VTDGEIVTRVRGGETRRYSELVQRYRRAVYALAQSQLGDWDEAQDAAQESFILAFQRLAQLRDPERFGAWIRTVTLNVCRQWQRSRREVPHPDPELLRTVEPAVDLDAVHTRMELRQALARLGDAARETLLLFYAGGYSHREIAALLDVPTTTIKSRLRNARATLRKELLDTMNQESAAHPLPEGFTEEVITRILRLAADGDTARITAVLEAAPAVANVQGAHPYWGGRPQPLQVAAEWGRLDVARALLDAGADPECAGSDYGGWKPLHLALHREGDPGQHREILELLLARGAVVDLHGAAAMGDAARVRALLDEAPSRVHAQGPNQAPPLHFAATRQVAELLLAAGADPHALDCYGKTAARAAAGYGTRLREVAEFLLDLTGEWDLILAGALGRLDRLTALLDEDPAAVQGPAPQGDTSLHAAARQGQAAAAQLLIERGAAVDARGQFGETPLHAAAGSGHPDVVRLLLEAGADPNATDEKHEAVPAAWARFQGHPHVAALLEPA
jgi:RNA polymerase sigma factor (sigma-70 family)